MKDIEIIIKALKCSASPGRHDCDGCFYEYVEPLSEAFKKSPRTDRGRRNVPQLRR